MTAASMADQARLVDALRDPGIYDHPTPAVEVIETHISYVLLAGGFAYKIKKAVDLGFLDFTDLEQRRHFCREELRLNRRTAPQLYLDVVAISGTPRHPRPGGGGRPLEYAVKMRRFPQEALAARLLEQGALTPEHLEQIAAAVAEFHEGAAAAPADSPYAAPEAVHRPVRENFTALAEMGGAGDRRPPPQRLQAWSDATFAALRPLLKPRGAAGRVRECHGDLHLGNLVSYGGAIVPFDCIEFAPELRWIDVVNEAAFLVMDLESRGRTDLAWYFLNRYLQRTGDYAGMALLAYYKAYRAMVRAKICRLRSRQPGVTAAEHDALAAQYRRYIALADGYTVPRANTLVITHGVSGAGKTVAARAVAARLGAVHLRSDVERKRLFGLEAAARSGSAPGEGIYTPDAGRRTYERLAELAAELLRGGATVIVDAAFLAAADRERLRRVAAESAVPFVILAAHAPEAELRRRIAARLAARSDASEADAAVLQRQLATRQPLDADERRRMIAVDTAVLDADSIARLILARAAAGER